MQDINILRTNSLSQETIQYPCFKPEISKKFEKIVNFTQKLFKLES